MKVLRAACSTSSARSRTRRSPPSAAGMVGTGERSAEDPHLQLPAEPRHRSPHRAHAQQARSHHRRRSRRAHQRAPDASSGRAPLCRWARRASHYFGGGRRRMSAMAGGAPSAKFHETAALRVGSRPAYLPAQSLLTRSSRTRGLGVPGRARRSYERWFVISGARPLDGRSA